MRMNLHLLIKDRDSEGKKGTCVGLDALLIASWGSAIEYTVALQSFEFLKI